MPWCPNCKTEYQEGITECADCKTALVDRLTDDLVPFFQAEDRKIAAKLANFFIYSDLNAALIHDEENDCYIVAIDPKKQMEAKKLYQAFYMVESERMLNGESDIFPFGQETDKKQAASSDEDDESDTADEANDLDASEDEADEAADAHSKDNKSSVVIIEEEDEAGSDDEELEADSADDARDITKGKATKVGRESSDTVEETTYIMKADRYKDLTGTVWLFLIFGLAGLVFVALNALGILSILTGWLPNIIMAALFLFFLYVAASTGLRARKLKEEIAAEEELTAKINEWLAGNVNEEFLKQVSDENASYEVNYLKQLATIKEMLIREFGQQNPAYLDRLIEEYYSQTFDQAVE